MVKALNLDTEKFNEAFKESGLRVGYVVDKLGISRQAFDRKRKGKVHFRLSEIYVLCDLMKITDDEKKNEIFFP